MTTHITCIEDLRQKARRRVPKVFYDYVDSGSWSEATYRGNEVDLARLTLKSRVVRDLRDRSLATTLAGQKASMPVALAPTGMAGMQRADGEILAAQAAEAAGVPFTMSTMSICSIEDVARATQSPFWFQIYMMQDRAFLTRLMDRAAAARCSALVVSLDLQMLSQRHTDIKNNRGAAIFALSRLPQLIRRPRWCLEMVRTRRHNFGNIAGHVDGVKDIAAVGRWTVDQFCPVLEWDDLRWIREQWKGKLILKGVMDEEDAVTAAEVGADAIVVSNHGGRQLDGAPSSITVLPRIARAVEGKTEVLMDSGIRSGQDVLKAIASGAHGVLIGRAYLYGLAAGGREGVETCLSIIRKELDLSMAMCGLRDVRDVSSAILDEPRV